MTKKDWTEQLRERLADYEQTRQRDCGRTLSVVWPNSQQAS